MAAAMKKDNAALGAVIGKHLASAGTAGPCPELESVAGLVDGSITGSERDRLLGHLALCDQCRDLFMVASELAEDRPAPQLRRSYRLPAAYAAAAVVILTLSLQLNPSREQAVVAKNMAPAHPETALAEKMDATPSAPVQESDVAAAEPSVPAQRPAALKVSAPDGPELARLLVGGGDPKQLAELAGREEKSFGFAVKGDPSSIAFRIGVNLMNLQVSLLGNDGDRAQAQVARLAPLLEQLSGTSEDSPLDRIGSRLEQGEAPNRVAGNAGELAQLVPKEQLPYARLGAWAQGAKLAAQSGNRRYLAAGVPRYFGVQIADSRMPVPAVAALRELDRKLKRPHGVDLEAVDQGVAELLAAF